MAYLTEYCLLFDMDENNSLLINTITGAMDIIDNPTKKYIISLREGKENSLNEDSETFCELKKRGYVFENKFEEEKVVLKLKKYNETMIENSFCSEFTISPTMGCNLRCTYCFESNTQHVNTRLMTQDQLKGIFKYILQIRKEKASVLKKMNKKINIRIFGGEPLLPGNREIIEQILAFGKENDILIGIVTNGTTVPVYVNLLEKYKDILTVQITLDGGKEIHDIRRIHANGKGTFDEICKNINLLISKKLKVNLRINIDKTNIAYLKELEKVISKNNWDNNEFVLVYAAPVVDFSGDSKSVLAEHELLNGLVEQGYCNSNTSFIRSIVSPCIGYLNIFFNPIAKHRFCKMNYCGATSGSELCFSPDGMVTTCLTYCGKAKHDIGTFDKEGVHLDESKYHLWTQRSVFRIEKCRKCKYAFLCGGGCPALALDQNGNIDDVICSDIVNTIECYVKNVVIKSALKTMTN